MSDKSKISGILAEIRNPLIFFALALLIIEGIIGTVVAKSDMSGDYQFYSVLIMAFLFLVVIITVAVITVFWPSHLYEEINEKLQASIQIEEFIKSDGFSDFIKDVIENQLKPECLLGTSNQEEK